ncbi:MAG: hypothetical protein JSV19_03865 [Phycisphaerales bacterium]|nr:MAG: hypothetical protein JSV19_03865 [Phycisphaerales bacterium]
MNRFAVRGGLAGAVTVLGGCGLAGAWKVVSISPDEAADRAPFHTVTFDEAGTYTDEHTDEEGTRRSTGQYTWTGLELGVTPKDGTTRRYSAHLRLDGRLALRRQDEHGKIAVVLERQEEGQPDG